MTQHRPPRGGDGPPRPPAVSSSPAPVAGGRVEVGARPPASAAGAPQPPLYSVRAVVDGVSSLVQAHFAGELRLSGSVLKVRARATGHALELGETTGTGPAVRIEAWLPARARRSIAETLGSGFDPLSLAGAEVILRVRLRFDGQYGLSAEVLGLDPDYVRSLVAREVERLRAALKASGDYGRQGRLPATPGLARIAVIGSQGAGYTDVARALQPLADAGLIALSWIPAAFEGPRAAASLCAALAQAAELAGRDGLDLVLLVRGGGGASGLMALNDAAVLRAACRLPVRIVTGLGHADDACLLDEIAYHAAITPTAAAEVVRADLRERAAAAQASCTGLRHDIRHLCDARLRPALIARYEVVRSSAAVRLQHSRTVAHELRSALDNGQARLAGAVEALARQRVAQAEALDASATRLPQRLRQELLHRRASLTLSTRQRVAILDDRGLRRTRLEHACASRLARHGHERERARLTLATAVHRRLASLRSQLQRARAALHDLSPEHVLRHGYALVITRDRQPLTSPAAIRAADRFDLLLADGVVACRLDEVLPPATRH